MSDQPGLAQRAPENQQADDSRLRIGAQAVLVALAIYLTIESARLGLWSSFGPGPGFFPFALAIALGLLAIAWFVQSLRGTAATRGTAGTQGTAISSRSAPVDRAHAIAVVASLVLLAATMNVLGYQLAMFLFLVFHLKVRAGRGCALTLILALVGSIGIYHGFDQGLMVQLPKSMFLAGWGL
jgi:hypothetical protein